MNLDARVANLTDTIALSKLEDVCFDVVDRLSIKQLRYLLTTPNSSVSLVKKNNKIVASAIILFRKNSKIARLYSFGVHPQFQNLGVGYFLMQQVEKNARENQCVEIRLEVRKTNHRAIGFYHKNGYELFGEYPNFYIDGEDALRMRKKLA